MLAIVLHPDAREKSQDEIDAVVGSERLPEPEDRTALPYLEALLKEVYRWNPPVPLVLPRRVTEENTYDSYTIPAGSMIMLNVWAIGRDPDYYEDPGVFKPERFLIDIPDPDPRDSVSVAVGDYALAKISGTPPYDSLQPASLRRPMSRKHATLQRAWTSAPRQSSSRG